MTGKSTRLPLRGRLGATAVLLLAAVGMVAAVAPASALVGTAPDTSAAPQAALTALADQAVAAGVPGVIVRVQDGHGPVVTVVRQGAWSTVDHALGANDEFRMGSNTKTVTATLVLQLVAEHRIALGDSVEKYLPGAIPGGRRITVRMLLNHTSGLDDYSFQPEALDLMTGNQRTRPTEAELLAVATKLPSKFTPGRGYSYSNAGYIALGMVLEKVSGHSMSELVQRRIAGPLGLRHTYLPSSSAPDADTSRLAHGYEPDAVHIAPLAESLGLPAGYGVIGPNHDDRVDATGINQSWDGAAGAIVSTTSDWARFDTALMSGRLLPRKLLAEMRTTVAEDEASGPSRTYGLGIEAYNTPCGTVWGHDGALPGYRSDNYTDETGRRTVSVLSTTHFGYKLDPAMEAAEARVVTGAICAMLGKPVPAA